VATVGVSLYGDVKFGIIILASHILGALLNGLLYRKVHFFDNSLSTEKSSPPLWRGGRANGADGVVNGSTLTSGVFVAKNSPFFKGGAPKGRGFLKEGDTPRPDLSLAISKSLQNSVQNILVVGGLIVIFFIASAPFGTSIAALLEMTTGVFHASQSAATAGILRLIIPTAIISFGGFCVAMQGAVFFRTYRLPMWFYFLYKVTHTILAVLVCIILFFIFH